MTTFILLLLVIIIILLVFLVTKKQTVDFNPIREDNIRLREKLAEKLGILTQNAIELKNISGDISNF